MRTGKETSGRRLRIITVVADLVKDPIAREGKCYAGYITESTHNTPSDQGYKQILMVNNRVVIHVHKYI